MSFYTTKLQTQTHLLDDIIPTKSCFLITQLLRVHTVNMFFPPTFLQYPIFFSAVQNPVCGSNTIFLLSQTNLTQDSGLRSAVCQSCTLHALHPPQPPPFKLLSCYNCSAPVIWIIIVFADTLELVDSCKKVRNAMFWFLGFLKNNQSLCKWWAQAGGYVLWCTYS